MRASVLGRGGGNWLHFSAKVGGWRVLLTLIDLLTDQPITEHPPPPPALATPSARPLAPPSAWTRATSASWACYMGASAIPGPSGSGCAGSCCALLYLQKMDCASGDADSPGRRAPPVSDAIPNSAAYGDTPRSSVAPKSHSAPNDTPTFDLRSRAEEGRGRHRHTAGRAGTTSGHGPRDLGAHLAVPPKPHPATCNGPFVEVAPLPAWRGRDQLKTGKMVSLSGRAIDECKEDAWGRYRVKWLPASRPAQNPGCQRIVDLSESSFSSI
eukprot:COSAG01_NODE_3082_length_6620_cov_24.480754_2_plen_269_part_00